MTAPIKARWARDIIRLGLDLLLPAQCAGCLDVGAILCRRCLRELMQRPSDLATSVPIRCLRPPIAVESAIAVSVVGHVKDHQLTAAQPALAAALRHSLSACMSIEPDRFISPLLVPIPASARAWRRRGFVLLESVLADRALARWIVEHNVEVSIDALEWVRHIDDQRSLGSVGRQHNLQHSLDAHGVANRDVIVVDDVVTTGATCAAASHALVRAGARSVAVVAIAAQPTGRSRHLP